MRRLRNRVASLDVHRDTVVACCQVAHPNQSVEVSELLRVTPRSPRRSQATSAQDRGPRFRSESHAHGRIDLSRELNVESFDDCAPTRPKATFVRGISLQETPTHDDANP